MATKVLSVNASKVGTFTAVAQPDDILDRFDLQLDELSDDAQHILEAARQLRHSDVPVAFPTETVYGLGADATRSDAVKGIYKAKQRPSDNPLIVHISSLKQLRLLLQPADSREENGPTVPRFVDPIPPIYRTLISRFWPGPLTIILPNPTNSVLAQEVTAGLDTFGARMPRHLLALALIELAGVPIAAPSANASTKPSPTAAEHVAYDLEGRIETILDGGPCDVGVESTVVDGLAQPPLILRPGGITLKQLRTVPDWENTQIGYQNVQEVGSQPRAPGMKYRHYSPKATVVLHEHGSQPPTISAMKAHAKVARRVGIIRTRRWCVQADTDTSPIFCTTSRIVENGLMNGKVIKPRSQGFAGLVETLESTPEPSKVIERHTIVHVNLQLLDIGIGPDIPSVARGIFASLRALDEEDVDVIFVEGLDDEGDGTAAAIMNRLRKAAEVHVDSQSQI